MNSVNAISASVSSAVQKSAPGSSRGSFADVLQSAVEHVEQVHGDAQREVTKLLSGEGGDIHNVMIAVEKADVSFQLMMQVRNKIVNAYQEISRMQF